MSSRRIRRSSRHIRDETRPFPFSTCAAILLAWLLRQTMRHPVAGIFERRQRRLGLVEELAQFVGRRSGASLATDLARHVD